MSDFNIGDIIKIKEGSKRADGRYIPYWMYLRTFKIIDIDKDIVTIDRDTVEPFKLNIDDIFIDDTISTADIDDMIDAVKKVMTIDDNIFKHERQSVNIYLRHDSNRPSISNVQGIRIVDPKIVNGRIRAKYLDDSKDSWSDDVWISVNDLIKPGKIKDKIKDKISKHFNPSKDDKKPNGIGDKDNKGGGNGRHNEKHP